MPKNRNNILKNKGVILQTLAFRKSVIEALIEIPINYNYKVLDVGCGSGSSLKQMMDIGFPPGQLYGIDKTEEDIEKGKKEFPNIHFRCGNAQITEYDSSFFDLVFESTMFIMLDNNTSQNIACEMMRIVKPKGYIMLIDWQYGKKQYNALSKKRITEMFEVGLMTEVICSKNGALLPPVGRFLSKHIPALYFPVQEMLPFLIGQKTTILQKT